MSSPDVRNQAGRSHTTPPAQPSIDRRATGSVFRGAEATILLTVLCVRVIVAWSLPCISRDGVTFCRYAQGLEQHGVAYLRAAEARQHPLFPALLLAAARTMRDLGFDEGPMLWQRAGQSIALASGMAVLLLSASIARRLALRLDLPLRAVTAGRVAMILVALLPLHNWLGVDAMSDELHLAFYLAAVRILLQLDLPGTIPSAALFGLSAGLAFLARPEAAALPPAAMVGLWAARRRLGWGGMATRAVVLAGMFIVCAAPYWAAVGKFSAKKNVLGDADSRQSMTFPSAASGARYAKLERVDYDWPALLPVALYRLLQSGKVVIPLLALAPMLLLGRRWLRAPLTGYAAVMLGHLCLALWLLARHDYLDVRHMLPIVALLTPLAALAVTHLQQYSSRQRTPALHLAVAVVAYGPLALLSARMPNAGDRYWPQAATELGRLDPDISRKAVFSGSSGQRLAFYTSARWVYWPEDPLNLETLIAQVRDLKPDYFAVEVGERFEVRGNRELLQRFMADNRVPPPRLLFTLPTPSGELRVFALHKQSQS